MIAAEAGAEGFAEYLIPLLALSIYFFTSLRKKKRPSQPIKSEEKRAPEPPLFSKREVVKASSPFEHPSSNFSSEVKTLPSTFSSIEQRQITSSIEKRSFSSSIEGCSIWSSSMLQDNDFDYTPKIKSQNSRAKKLFSKRSSLRQAFLLQEILKRPFE